MTLLAACRKVALEFSDERPPSCRREAKGVRSRVLAVAHPDVAIDTLAHFDAFSASRTIRTFSPRSAAEINRTHLKSLQGNH